MPTLLDTMAELSRRRTPAEIEETIRRLTALADLAGADRANRGAVLEARELAQALRAKLRRNSSRSPKPRLIEPGT